LGAALGVLVLLAPAPSEARHPDQGPGPLPWRIGHEVGFTADAVAFPDSSDTILELYVRIRPSLIADLCRDGRDPMPVRVSAQLRSIFGGKTQEREQVFQVNPADTAVALGEVVVLSFPVKPGPHRLQVRLETRRRTLARMGAEKPEVAKVDGDLEVPKPQAGREISDLEFIWGEAEQGAARVFGRSGHGLLPNPERIYGLYSTDLRAFFAARGATSESRPWHWVARILNPRGEVQAVQESTAAAGPSLSTELRMDVGSLPAGGYDLEVKAWQDGDPGALLRRSRFNVAWTLDSWRRDPLDVADDAHFLLEADAEERFERLQAGEQEAILDSFWLTRDPTPETGENEARSLFLRRVDYANRMYGRYGLGRGMFSDMGRTFIRYGEPGEVLKQVVPGLDDNLANMVRDLSRSEDRPLDNVQQHELGADMRPFELWIYEGEIPMPVDADPRIERSRGTRRRIVFLFVDQNHLGDYRLVYSSE
jgi:GWxTD domain-containing protein